MTAFVRYLETQPDGYAVEFMCELVGADRIVHWACFGYAERE